jgi:hypothetical protein
VNPVSETNEDVGAQATVSRWNAAARRFRPFLSLIITAVIAPVLALTTKASGSTSIVIGLASFCAVELVITAEELRRGARDRSKLEKRVAGLGGISQRWQAEVDRLVSTASRLANLTELESQRFDERTIFSPVISVLDKSGSHEKAAQIVATLMRRDLSFLANYASEALARGRYPIDVERSDYEDLLFSQYDGRPQNREFCATVTAANLNWFLTDSGVVFTRQMMETYKRGRLSSIRRVFIYNTSDEMDSLEVRLFLKLHSVSPYSIKAMSISELIDIVRRATRAKMVVTDFGIHANSSVWETRTTTDGSFRGYFVFDPVAVRQYSNVFDRIWECADDVSTSLPVSFADVPDSIDISFFRERIRLMRNV